MMLFVIRPLGVSKCWIQMSYEHFEIPLWCMFSSVLALPRTEEWPVLSHIPRAVGIANCSEAGRCLLSQAQYPWTLLWGSDFCFWIYSPRHLGLCSLDLNTLGSNSACSSAVIMMPEHFRKSSVSETKRGASSLSGKDAICILVPAGKHWILVPQKIAFLQPCKASAREAGGLRSQCLWMGCCFGIHPL